MNLKEYKNAKLAIQSIDPITEKKITLNIPGFEALEATPEQVLAFRDTLQNVMEIPIDRVESVVTYDYF